jgi:hypothetical protein
MILMNIYKLCAAFSAQTTLQEQRQRQQYTGTLDI